VNKLRISGGEPTLGKEHLLQVLSLTEAAGLLFILETNGILLGHDAAYARALAHYRHIHMRVSLKAGSPTGFQARTGARGEFWELPFQAIEHLQQAGVPSHVAAMTDPQPDAGRGAAGLAAASANDRLQGLSGGGDL
jgi:uncharacterized Fe-S cluster-containing radical SAM superfamily protein